MQSLILSRSATLATAQFPAPVVYLPFVPSVKGVVHFGRTIQFLVGGVFLNNGSVGSTAVCVAGNCEHLLADKAHLSSLQTIASAAVASFYSLIKI